MAARSWDATSGGNVRQAAGREDFDMEESGTTGLASDKGRSSSYSRQGLKRRGYCDHSGPQSAIQFKPNNVIVILIVTGSACNVESTGTDNEHRRSSAPANHISHLSADASCLLLRRALRWPFSSYQTHYMRRRQLRLNGVQ